MGEMDMTTKEQIHPTLVEEPDRLMGPAHHPITVQTWRVEHGMVPDNHFTDLRAVGGEHTAQVSDLLTAQPATISSQALSGYCTDNDQTGAFKAWVELTAHIAAIASQRVQQAQMQVEEGHIVVAGHHQLRYGQGITQLYSRPPLRAKIGPLHKIARDNDQIGLELRGLTHQSPGNRWIKWWTGVQVRDVEDPIQHTLLLSHGGLYLSGTRLLTG